MQLSSLSILRLKFQSSTRRTVPQRPSSGVRRPSHEEAEAHSHSSGCTGDATLESGSGTRTLDADVDNSNTPLSRVQYHSQIDRRFCGMLYNLSLDLKYQHFHNQDSKSLSSIFFLFILSSFRLQLATLIAVYNFLVQCCNSCHNDLIN